MEQQNRDLYTVVTSESACGSENVCVRVDQLYAPKTVIDYSM